MPHSSITKPSSGSSLLTQIPSLLFSLQHDQEQAGSYWAMSLGHHLWTEPAFAPFCSQGSTGSLLRAWGGRVRSRAVVAGVRDVKQESEQQQQEEDGDF